MNRLIALLLVMATLVVAPLAASAALITVPSDLSPGDTYRLAFLTSTTRNATSTNIDDYNSFVAARAAAVPELAALGTDWKAIASTASMAARDNTGTNPTISPGVPIYGLDDTRIADNNADLWDGTIAAALDLSETGLSHGYSYVWSGSSWDGTYEIGPGGPQRHLGSPNPIIGDITNPALGTWLTALEGLPGYQLPLYAMSGDLTVVPEPSTLFLVWIGASAVVGWRLGIRRAKR